MILIIFFNIKILHLILFAHETIMLANLIVFHAFFWLLKMHKTPSGVRFILAGKKCIKQLSKYVT